jgi:pimeloyl-ACP methyl ester carboxylesterase
MARIEINGFPIHYQSDGDGPDVVLVHGLCGDLAFWHPAIVSGLAKEFRVTRLDLRGHGYSGRPASGYTTRDMAADLAGLFDHLGIRRASLVGHSYGGAVALHFAALHPGRTAAVVLADVRVRSLQPSQGLRDWTHWQGILDRLREHGIEVQDDVLEGDFHFLDELARLRLAGRLERLDLAPFFVPFAASSPRRARQWLRLAEETTSRADFGDLAGLTPELIGRIGAPALLFYGSLSHCLPTQERLAGLLRDATVLREEGVGHFLPLVRPQSFLDHTRLFLTGVAGRAAAFPAPGALSNPAIAADPIRHATQKAGA